MAFAFVLKNPDDRKRIREGDVLVLSDLFVTVVESVYTVSGKMLAVLESGAGMLDIKTILIDGDKRWEVSRNNLDIGNLRDNDLQKRVKDNFWFLYILTPIEHTERPTVQQKLQVVKDDTLG